MAGFDTRHFRTAHHPGLPERQRVEQDVLSRPPLHRHRRLSRRMAARPAASRAGLPDFQRQHGWPCTERRPRGAFQRVARPGGKRRCGGTRRRDGRTTSFRSLRCLPEDLQIRRTITFDPSARPVPDARGSRRFTCPHLLAAAPCPGRARTEGFASRDDGAAL